MAGGVQAPPAAVAGSTLAIMLSRAAGCGRQTWCAVSAPAV